MFIIIPKVTTRKIAILENTFRLMKTKILHTKTGVSGMEAELREKFIAVNIYIKKE